MKKNKLITSSLVYTLGNLLVQGLAFITLPIYTRLMTQEDFGRYSLYTSWVGIVGIFVGLQMSGSYSIAKTKYNKFEEYVATTVTISVIVFSIIFGMFYLFQDYISSFLGFSNKIVLLLVIQSYLGYLYGCLSQYFVQRQESTRQFVLSFGTSILNIIISILLLYSLEDNFIARIIGGFIPAVCGASYCLFFIYKKSSVIIDKKYINFIFIISIPLIFHILGHNLLNQLDRVMLGKMINESAVAIYSFGYSLGLIIQIVLGSLNTAWVPWYFAEKKKENKELITKYKERYLVIATFLTIGYLSIFPELVSIMGPEKYQVSKEFIALIIVSYFLVYLYTFPVNEQFFYGNTNFIPIGTFLSALINYGLNLIFIAKYGIYGAAVATLISYLLLLVFHHIIAKRKYNFSELGLKEYLLTLVPVCGYGVFSTIFINNLPIRWGTCFIIFLILVRVYKKDIVSVIKRK